MVKKIRIVLAKTFLKNFFAVNIMLHRLHSFLYYTIGSIERYRQYRCRDSVEICDPFLSVQCDKVNLFSMGVRYDCFIV